MTDNTEYVYSRFWEEVPQEDNPFTAAQCFCSGYDVYGELIEKAGWIDYLYLLFFGEKPSNQQSQLLNSLAVALANPGPRDHSVMAAMSAAAGGSTAASSLMAALAVGAGNLSGAREVYQAMLLWSDCGTDLVRWQRVLRPENYQGSARKNDAREDVWPPLEHPPGFAPYGVSCALLVQQTLKHLTKLSTGPHLPWLRAERCSLEAVTGLPLSLSGLAACTMIDLGLDAEQGEMLYLLLRLPGAAAHSLEQRERGWRSYPFYAQGIQLTNDPQE